MSRRERCLDIEAFAVFWALDRDGKGKCGCSSSSPARFPLAPWLSGFGASSTLRHPSFTLVQLNLALP
ncbi:hypothetical protein JOM49_000521 [Amycolatopsis magusensis]|uniref:Uncharacterized protein n=1 Tax=Amycolatopsis magusensis TaxID=882444 RepID=A0ABS4PHX6_9PSEU|nr:hypothetical protein [Amycolatopsis magusensis]